MSNYEKIAEMFNRNKAAGATFEFVAKKDGLWLRDLKNNTDELLDVLDIKTLTLVFGDRL